MEILEEKRDLTTVDNNEYYLVQCISANFAMATGIEVQFNDKYNQENKLEDQSGDNIYSLDSDSCCILHRNKVFILVMKRDHYQKPTYDILKQLLYSMKKILINNPEIIDKDKIAISKIGYGLDRLDWDKVKPIIKEVFQDTNLKILICDQ